MFSGLVSVWMATSILGLAGLFLFNKTWWRTQTEYDDFDLAEKIGLEGYGVVIQLISVLLVLGGFAGFVLFGT